MNIANVSMYPNHGYALTAINSGRMSLPVSPGSYIYSQFKHVSGTLAPEGTQGVAISKLKILDVLIEQMSQMKKQPDIDVQALSDGQIDALISQYEGQIKAAQAAKNIVPYAPAPQAPAGILFNISA